jgi:hypothetical protein
MRRGTRGISPQSLIAFWRGSGARRHLRRGAPRKVVQSEMDPLWLLRPALRRWRRRGWASKINISAQLDLSPGKWRCCHLQIMNNNAEFEVLITSIKSRRPTGMLLAPSDSQSTMIPVEAKATTKLEVSWVLPRKGRVRPGFERPMLRTICIRSPDRWRGSSKPRAIVLDLTAIALNNERAQFSIWSRTQPTLW